MRVRELRIAYAPVAGTTGGRQRLTTPAEMSQFLRPFLEHEAVEVLMLVLFDTKQQVIAVHTLSRGTLDSTVVHPRDVFKAAVLANAAGLVTAHNHPSGIATPSQEDLLLFARLNSAAEVMGIALLDYVIVGAGGTYWSMKEHR